MLPVSILKDVYEAMFHISLDRSQIYFLLVDLPQYLIKRLQGVQNAAARSILRTPISAHISHSSRTFTGYLSIGEPYTRLLHYVTLHSLALVLSTCLTLLMFTPLLDPCVLPQIFVSRALLMSN